MRIWLFLLGLLHSSALSFLALSDMHFDIKYSCGNDLAVIGNASCETSEKLLNSLLSSLSNLSNSSDFVIILGDELAHGLSAYPVIKLSTQFLFTKFQHYLPNTLTLHTVGNNEGFQSNQSAREEADHLAFLYEFWVPSALKAYKFLKNGYYSLQVSNLTLIILNSNHLIKDTNDSEAQLLWIKEELRNSNKKVLIFTHSPPLNSFYNSGERIWTESNTEGFREIIRAFRSKIIAIICGHIHKGVVGVFEGVSVVAVPPVSPVFSSVPSFRRFDVSDNKLDFEEFSLDIQTGIWESSYIFSEVFGDLTEIGEIELEMERNQEFVDNYVRASRGMQKWNNSLEEVYRLSTNSDREIEFMRNLVVCSIKDLSFVEFLECRDRFDEVFYKFE